MYKDLRSFLERLFNIKVRTLIYSRRKFIKLHTQLLKHIGLHFLAQIITDTLCDVDNLPNYINEDTIRPTHCANQV